MKNRNVISLEAFKEKNYGKRGTKRREALEAASENYFIGVLLQQARLAKGLTQEELAEKVGTTKSYISKIENNIKEVTYVLWYVWVVIDEIVLLFGVVWFLVSVS